MPRRKSEWDQVKQGYLNMQELGKTVEEREYIPEKACGKCKNFLFSNLMRLQKTMHNPKWKRCAGGCWQIL